MTVERGKSPTQHSAAKQTPLKDDRHTVRAYVSGQTISDLKKLSVKMFGSSTEVPAVVRFACQELINERLYPPISQPEVAQ